MEARMTSDITAGTDSDRLIDRLDLCLAAAPPGSEQPLLCTRDWSRGGSSGGGGGGARP